MAFTRFKKFSVSKASLRQCRAKAETVNARIESLKNEISTIDLKRAELENIGGIKAIKDLELKIQKLRMDKNSYEVGDGLFSKLLKTKFIKREVQQEIDTHTNEIYQLNDLVRNSTYSVSKHKRILDQITWLEKYLAPIQRRVNMLVAKEKKEQERKNYLTDKIKAEKEKRLLEIEVIKQKKKEQISELKGRLAYDNQEKRKQFNRQKRFLRNHGNCPYCGIEFDLTIEIHTDHIYPLSKGGLNVL